MQKFKRFVKSGAGTIVCMEIVFVSFAIACVVMQVYAAFAEVPTPEVFRKEIYLPEHAQVHLQEFKSDATVYDSILSLEEWNVLLAQKEFKSDPAVHLSVDTRGNDAVVVSYVLSRKDRGFFIHHEYISNPFGVNKGFWTSNLHVEGNVLVCEPVRDRVLEGNIVIFCLMMFLTVLFGNLFRFEWKSFLKKESELLPAS